MERRQQPNRGMTLVEVLFTVGFVSVAFMGIYAVFQLSIDIISGSKARAGALALANEQMERVRSLSYASVGTVGGIPSGSLLQTETITLNQTNYTRRTFIQYADDPADGLAAADQNGITTDYKVVKVEMLWTVRSVPRALSLVSTVVPEGVESLTGGGTLRVSIFDALAIPISGATVRVRNSTGTSTVDVTTFSNASGVVVFPGAPIGAGYQISVSKPGYSSAQTYSATASNPNPVPGHLSVASGQTTASSFAIDRLASMTIRTLSPVEEEGVIDAFEDTDTVFGLVGTEIENEKIILQKTGSTYVSTGVAKGASTTPALLSSWKQAVFSVDTPAQTTARVRVYAVDGATLTLVPDSALPGNSAGFTTSPISLAPLPSGAYASLALGVELGTSEASSTPALLSWGILYDRGPVPVPSIPFAVRGSKTIGTNGSGAAIYKFSQSLTTDAAGMFATSTLEWDTYTLTFGSAAHDVAEICAQTPISIQPGDSKVVDAYLVPNTAHSVRVVVTDAQESFVPNANIRLYRSGYDVTEVSSACGQTFFPALTAATNYTAVISKTGYQTRTISNVSISGDTVLEVALMAL